ncbi:DUF3574 domain-containing protein [Streptomyces sp. TRM 70351]|uniref:DUF3574 domain-containing protein n=1 Tax=Streptomyces sp. TRM 70351 TaxID=3116552 RepID=UPI002E7C25EE|nr:DUF3574 domain-containing protein [Streptomyces sp. TRM 70351]MEE1927084.1 DUF3574 domain-containing protein [Streptomyces sp. TRM 70351]
MARTPHWLLPSLTAAALILSAVSLALVFLALGRQEASGADRPVSTPHVLAGQASAQGQEYMETRLFFGTGRHDGKPPITEDEFHAFLNDYITPRFPAGLTLQEGHGQWRDRDGDVNRERSYELILLYPTTTAKDSDAAIEEIRRAYTTRWELESVGRVDARVRVDF